MTEQIEGSGKVTLEHGKDYEVVALGGNGWSIGLGSLIRMLSGPDEGMLFTGDLDSRGLNLQPYNGDIESFMKDHSAYRK